MGEDVTRLEYLDGSTYPPARTGMRGSHPGSFDVGHRIRDGERFTVDDLPVDDTVESRRRRRRDQRARDVMVLPAASARGDDPAPRQPRRLRRHAKRNELRVDDRLLIGYGGSEALQSPNSLYSGVAKGLIRALGVEIERFETAFDRELHPSLGLSRGLFFSREAFGVDALVSGDPMRMVADDIAADRMNERPWAEFVAAYPVSDAAKAALIELATSTRDPLEGRTQEEKIALLESTSYRDYIQGFWGLDDEAADTFQGRAHDFFAMGIDRVSAYDAMETGYPGFAGLELPVDPVAAARDGGAVHLPLPGRQRVTRAAHGALAHPRRRTRRPRWRTS